MLVLGRYRTISFCYGQESLLDPSNVTNLRTSFNVGEQEITIMPDPVHMLKLVRNTLGEKENLLNSRGQRISWNYIVRLHELQQNEGLHLANKLRNQHINYTKQIMKVKLTAKTFSNSVAKAVAKLAEATTGLLV